MDEGIPCRSGSAGTEVLIFRIAAPLSGSRLVPVVETCRVNMLSKIAMEQYRLGVVSPGASQIDTSLWQISCESAVVEDIPVGQPLRCGGGCGVSQDPSGSFLGYHRDDLTAVKEGDGTAEDKIDISADGTVFI